LAILFTSLKKFTLKKESPIGNAVRSPWCYFHLLSHLVGLLLNLQIWLETNKK
jgi:hypothetical protein